ncbi:hypothetical protein T265_15084, partial [Opisthorchis viverrini]
ASTVSWWGSGNTLASHVKCTEFRLGHDQESALRMSSNKMETRAQCFPFSMCTHQNLKKPSNCNTLLVPSCQATWRKHDGLDTTRQPNPREKQSRFRGWTRTKGLLPFDDLFQGVQMHESGKVSFATVTPFRCLAAMPPEGSTSAGILPSCPRGSRTTDHLVSKFAL